MQNLRKLHINEEIWKWYLRGQRGNIIIFSPHGKRFEVSLIDFATHQGEIDPEYLVEHLCYNLTPGEVKKYIEDVILKSS